MIILIILEMKFHHDILRARHSTNYNKSTDPKAHVSAWNGNFSQTGGNDSKMFQDFRN